ncbi:unnamed protein product, partial [Linum tenue]
GDSATEPYIVTHNLLLAHAAGYRLYESKYKEKQQGVVGITIVTFYLLPYSSETADVDAAQRALDFMYGWYMDPITFGHYPRNMVDLVGSRHAQELLRKMESLLVNRFLLAVYVS